MIVPPLADAFTDPADCSFDAPSGRRARALRSSGTWLMLVGCALAVACVAVPRDVDAAAIVALGVAVAGALYTFRERARSHTRDELAEASSWILDHAADGIVLTDARGIVTCANRRAAVLLGGRVTRGDRMLEVARTLEREAGAEGLCQRVAALYDDPRATEGGEMASFGDALRICGWLSEPLRDADGTVVGRGFVFHDQTQERELATLKNEFLSTVTHELRTPLTSVKGSLQLILSKGAVTSAIDRELLDISLKNTDRLIRLVNDILDVSRLECGTIDLHVAPVEVRSLVDEAVAGLRAYASGRDIAMHCEVGPDLPAVVGDRDRLIQVLTNLVSNAVKFSPVGGRIVVRALAAPDGVAIAVRDWGIGIRSHDQPRLFRRFQRLNPDRSEEPGTGLGLAISKAIVERHGGRIVVDSIEAEGSTFTVVLPGAAGAATASARDTDGATACTVARPTLLLIDDDADLGTVLEVSLGGAFRVLRVERGVQALDVARAERPDLILLDVVLPDLSGYDVLRILQNSEATRSVPVVMLTVRPERELAWRLGATDVVAKPIDVDELRHTLERVLRRRNAGTGLIIAVGPLRTRPARTVAAALEAGGHAVFTADDAWALLRSLDECAPDVAVVDAQMEDGPDKTMAFLRGHHASRGLPVVLLTDGAHDGIVPPGCVAVLESIPDVDLVRAVEHAAHNRRPVSAPACVVVSA